MVHEHENHFSLHLIANFCFYLQADGAPVKLNINCRVQGDVVLECIHLDNDMEHEDIILRVMFNTSFIQFNTLVLTREEIDVVWNGKDQFSRDFKAEVGLLFILSGSEPPFQTAWYDGYLNIHTYV